MNINGYLSIGIVPLMVSNLIMPLPSPRLNRIGSANGNRPSCLWFDRLFSTSAPSFYHGLISNFKLSLQPVLVAYRAVNIRHKPYLYSLGTTFRKQADHPLCSEVIVAIHLLATQKPHMFKAKMPIQRKRFTRTENKCKKGGE